MAEAEWFYGQNNQQRGPVSLQMLVDLLRSGQLNPGDMVWREGMPNWMPAGQTPELAGAGTRAMADPIGPVGGYQGGQQGGYQGGTPYGGTVGYAGPAGGEKSYFGLAMTSFILSLPGLFILNIILGPLAIIFAIIALVGIGKGGNPRGKGFAIAGLILGILDIVVLVVVLVALTNMRRW